MPRRKKDIILSTASKEELAWLRQPLNFALWRGEASSAEVKIMMGITRALQDKITKLWFKRDQNGNAPTLFDDDNFDQDGELVFHLNFSEAGIGADEYRNLTPEFAKKMMQFHYPSIEDGVAGYRQLFNFVGTTLDTQKKYSRKNELVFKMGRKTVDYVFDLTQTHRFLESVVNNCKNIYSARLYIILTAKASLGKWDVTVDDLRGTLLSQGRAAGHKSTDNRQERGQMIEEVVEKYTQYKDFRNYVLKKAYHELKDLAEHNLIDLYFEYTEIYPEGKKRGTPERIHFDIITTELGKQETLRKEENRRRIALEQKLVQTFSITLKQSRDFLSMIDSEHLTDFEQKCDTLAAELKERTDITRPAAYAMTRLSEIVASYVPNGNEIENENENLTDNKRRKTKDENAPSVEFSAVAQQSQSQSQNLPPHWQEVTDAMLTSATTPDERTLLRSYLFDAFKRIELRDDNILIIYCDSRTTARMFVKRFGQHFAQVILQHLNATKYQFSYTLK